MSVASATASGRYPGEPEGMAFKPDHGSLEYEFWSAQRSALDAFMAAQHDITAFLGGFGSGKTVTGARLVVTLAWNHPGSKHAAMAIDFQKGAETTYETLFKNLPGERTHILTSNYNGPENSPIVADYNRNDHRLTLINDSVIRLASADHPQSVIGDEFQSVWLDEPSKYHPDSKLFDIALDVVPSRLRAHEPQYGQFWSLTGNGYNAAYEILKERQNADGEEIGQRIKIVRASNQNNPYLSDVVKERFARQYEDSAKAEQALHGGFAAAEGLVYSVRRDDHVVGLEIWEDEDGREHPAVIEPIGNGETRTIPVEEEYRVYGYDHGWHPDPRALVSVGRTIDDRLIVLDEFKATKSPIENSMRWLSNRPGGVIAAEHQPEDIEDLNDGSDDVPEYDQTRFEAKEANKSIEAGIEAISKRLNPFDDESGEPLPPRLLIAERCEELINEFFSYKREHIGGSEAEDHLLDCLRYAIMAIDRGEDVSDSMAFGTLEVG